MGGNDSTFEKVSVGANFSLKLLAQLTEAAAKAGQRMSFSIVDESGANKASLRMDGASFTSAFVAADKAYTAASGRPTHLWHDTLAEDEVLGGGARSAIPRLTTLGGGYPIVLEGRLVGGVGVSGGHYTDDMAVAVAALVQAGAKHEW
ncbi:heme-binding protein [Streptomyces solisilvae]|uniref:GlcG/HbpS family heme-binding protein n=1 Tax=Streptomyces malaysiensis TaxID=92644 RepID=UPI0036D05169